ncbi:MAG: SAM-dependent DNA methyltransferase, partial [Chloroflexi bacterium]|nr:SAM-dependent DNA methyltransferase [Chloroflexota bacterium]
MLALKKAQRNLLAKVVLQARELAEAGARKALHALGVDESDAPGHLTPDQRILRRALRAQARQLGDREDPEKKGQYLIRHLVEKIAYDQWHRLLFARFLAENDLLISPQHGVGVSLADCGELAPEMGLRDGWEVAARFAAAMLPQIFRADDPAGQTQFAPEDRHALQLLVVELPCDTFLADDGLGWVYQFWQAQRKEEVNRSEVKIGADELSPVTQLFTEDYMVLFLLHNTLGAWWAGKKVGGITAATEEEARAAVALPGVNWEYLRFVRDEQTDAWRPAAGSFLGWPKTAKELRFLDPCMGSGHFLVFALFILVALRMAEEGLSQAEACEAVLRDNLLGLELDPRCTQIAAFNLALAAWKWGGYGPLPPLNLACCGLSLDAKREDWLKLAEHAAQASSLAPERDLLGSEENLLTKQLRFAMGALYDLFQKAPVLGSLINPRRDKAVTYATAFHELQPLLEQALKSESADETVHELAVTAQGMAKAAEILAGQFHLVAT